MSKVENSDNSKSIEIKNNAIKKEVKIEKTKASKSRKSICRVLVATPSYFVIDKEGKKIRIDKKNNHYRGEEIYF